MNLKLADFFTAILLFLSLSPHTLASGRTIKLLEPQIKDKYKSVPTTQSCPLDYEGCEWVNESSIANRFTPNAFAICDSEKNCMRYAGEELVWDTKIATADYFKIPLDDQYKIFSGPSENVQVGWKFGIDQQFSVFAPPQDSVFRTHADDEAEVQVDIDHTTRARYGVNWKKPLSEMSVLELCSQVTGELKYQAGPFVEFEEDQSRRRESFQPNPDTRIFVDFDLFCLMYKSDPERPLRDQPKNLLEQVLDEKANPPPINFFGAIRMTPIREGADAKQDVLMKVFMEGDYEPFSTRHLGTVDILPVKIDGRVLYYLGDAPCSLDSSVKIGPEIKFPIKFLRTFGVDVGSARVRLGGRLREAICDHGTQTVEGEFDEIKDGFQIKPFADVSIGGGQSDRNSTPDPTIHESEEATPRPPAPTLQFAPKRDPACEVDSGAFSAK